MSTRSFNIFYSWQSDLPDTTNRGLIRKQIRLAANKIESAGQYVIQIDEATRDTAGSPNIPMTILEKILGSDLFICDVSTINKESESRKCPNPNVVFELGFAVAHLGWNRVILLFNEEYGPLQDLPFDFDRHRASPYRAGEIPSKEQENKLCVLVEAAVTTVMRIDPPKPTAKFDPDETKRSRDIRTLTHLLSHTHTPTLDDHMNRLPDSMSDTALDFWERFNSILDGNSFHLYDRKASELVKKLWESFRITVSHGEQYHLVLNTRNYTFVAAQHGRLSEEQEDVYHAIGLARDSMREHLKELLNHVRENYVEIDLVSTNLSAWKEYVEEQRALLKSIGVDV